jgi:glycosyltransferase involved in cell wall biosynthesis
MQPAQFFVWTVLVFKLFSFSSAKLIFDTHISIYDTFIGDRQLAGRFSLKAVYYYLLDFLSCFIADALIFDTALHRDYFVKTFFIPTTKLKLVVPVCVDLDFVAAQKQSWLAAVPAAKTKFEVLFFGLFIPLQGVPQIIEAAHLLRDDLRIHFTLIGAGQTKAAAVAQAEKLNLPNLEFIKRISYQELFPYIFKADVCLGIFGQTDKAARVIPNKLLESMAAGKITITGSNPEIATAFIDGQELLLCPMGDAAALAAKIKQVADQPERYYPLELAAEEKIKATRSLTALEKIYLAPFWQWLKIN